MPPPPRMVCPRALPHTRHACSHAVPHPAHIHRLVWLMARPASSGGSGKSRRSTARSAATHGSCAGQRVQHQPYACHDTHAAPSYPFSSLCTSPQVLYIHTRAGAVCSSSCLTTVQGLLREVQMEPAGAGAFLRYSRPPPIRRARLCRTACRSRCGSPRRRWCRLAGAGAAAKPICTCTCTRWLLMRI